MMKLRYESEADTQREPLLTNRDHRNLDAFIGHAIDDVLSGAITKEQAIGGLNQMIAALDKGNVATARNWLEQGRELLPSLAVSAE